MEIILLPPLQKKTYMYMYMLYTHENSRLKYNVHATNVFIYMCTVFEYHTSSSMYIHVHVAYINHIHVYLPTFNILLTQVNALLT